MDWEDLCAIFVLNVVLDLTRKFIRMKLSNETVGILIRFDAEAWVVGKSCLFYDGHFPIFVQIDIRNVTGGVCN